MEMEIKWNDAEGCNVLAAIEQAGFDGAIAIATEAEIQAGAACGQMCLVTEAIEAK